MKRDPRLWFPLAFLAAGSLLTLATLLLPRLAKPRPTEQQPAGPAAVEWWSQVPIDGPPPNRPDPPPWMKCETLAAGLLDAPGLRVVHPEGSAYCYVFDADAGPAAPDDLPPATEEYADCWLGIVLCGADWTASHPDEAALPFGPHACLAGDFYLFGDRESMEKVRPVAEQVHFGPYRGVGRPKTPRP